MSTLADLAQMDTGYGVGRAVLSLEAGWASRWSATWRVGRTPVSCAVRDLGVFPVAGSVPVRRFTWRTGQRHRPGLAYAVSTGRHHGFESFGEECLLLAADFAAGLVEVLAQPFRLAFRTGDGGGGEHIPDFLLLTRAQTWLVDVRPAARIGAEDRVRFAAAAEAALAVGWRYAVVAGWRPFVLEVVEALSAQRRELVDRLGVEEELLARAGRGPVAFGGLVQDCALPAVARAHALHLLWHRELGVELSGPLRDASLIRRAPQGGRR